MVSNMEKPGSQKKPRIFELWDQIFGTDAGHEAVKHGGKKTNDR